MPTVMPETEHMTTAPITVSPSTTPEQLRLSRYRLFAFDMDSTLIGIECIDEIADHVGKKAEVAAITEATMRGEITSFKDSLRQRVALLKGVTTEQLQEVITHRLRFNPGVEKLLAALQAQGIKTLLVSGGFTFFAEHVVRELKIDFMRSNVLDINDKGVLTGKVAPQDWGDICDGQAKQDMLLATCRQLGIAPEQTAAVGDGSNDIPMMQAAGLSVAYCAKPKVQDVADICINQPDIASLLTVLQ